ncbi:FAD-dependent oxidoreductase, partial [Sphaerisporangium rubeum]
MSGAPVAPVAVVGGGLAGITAAVALADAGIPVTVYEARPRLGGATHSFTRGGLTVDNGQHVFLRCCTAYRGLLDRIGGARGVRLQDRFDVRVLTPQGRSGR